MLRRRSQLPKSRIRNLSLKNVRGQEELVGFGFIIVIVAVIMIIIMSIAFRGGDENEFIESYKVENFLLALSSHTTDCAKNTYYKTIGELITEGVKQCDDGRITYEVMQDEIDLIVNESWANVGFSRGYILNVTYLGNEIFLVSSGNRSVNNQGSRLDLTKEYGISFIVYS